jgi:hypothetical protein
MFMNYLVFLDPYANELEKILSGVKCMLVKGIDISTSKVHPINQGDSLYFLRNKSERDLLVKANVLRVLTIVDNFDHELSHVLKEFQPKLQLTEHQYNHWSRKKQVLLVEFEAAHKIQIVQVSLNEISETSDWIAFAEFKSITG